MIFYCIFLSKVKREPHFRNHIISLILVVTQARGLVNSKLLSILILMVSAIPKVLYVLLNDKFVAKRLDDFCLSHNIPLN